MMAPTPADAASAAARTSDSRVCCTTPGMLPIGIGCIMANIPVTGMNDAGGLFNVLYAMGISNELFPLLIFIGVGAIATQSYCNTSFGPRGLTLLEQGAVDCLFKPFSETALLAALRACA